MAKIWKGRRCRTCGAAIPEKEGVDVPCGNCGKMPFDLPENIFVQAPPEQKQTNQFCI